MKMQLIPDYPTRTSPLSGQQYSPLIQTDYSSETQLCALLTSLNVHTVISMVSLDFPDVAEAQCVLIRAASQSASVKRFMPSEYNVDYDLDDEKLPYPEKKYHTVARRQLEKTELEYTYVYPGMFMDYFGMPYFPTHMRPLYLTLDVANNAAAIPGDGNTFFSVSYTKDVARYIAGAVDLPKWPRVLTIVGSRITTNELVALAEKVIGRKLEVRYDPIEKLIKHDFKSLPSNTSVAENFPGGISQVAALVADLNASIGAGAYDFADLKDSVDLVKALEGKLEPMLKIEDFMQQSWEGR